MARQRNETAHEARRSEILRVAATLFLERGFHQTGIAAICDALGMSPGALYRYFPSKAEIILAIVDADREETEERIGALGRAPDFRAALVAGLDEAMCAMSGEARLALEIAAEGARDEAVRDRLARSDREARAALAAAIARAMAAGEVGPEVEPEGAAALIVALVDGAAGPAGAAFAGLPPERRATALARLIEGLLGPKRPS